MLAIKRNIAKGLERHRTCSFLDPPLNAAALEITISGCLFGFSFFSAPSVGLVTSSTDASGSGVSSTATGAVVGVEASSTFVCRTGVSSTLCSSSTLGDAAGGMSFLISSCASLEAVSTAEAPPKGFGFGPDGLTVLDRNGEAVCAGSAETTGEGVTGRVRDLSCNRVRSPVEELLGVSRLPKRLPIPSPLESPYPPVLRSPYPPVLRSP
jgi:hypothetical protein